MNKRLNKILWVALPATTVGFLVAATVVMATHRINVVSYQIPYHTYSNLRDFQSFHDVIEERVDVDFESLKLVNSSIIKCDIDGEILRFDVAASYKKENENYLLNIQLTDDKYFVWSTSDMNKNAGEKAYLSDSLLASISYFSSTSFFSITNIEFIDETITDVTKEDLIYDGTGLRTVADDENGQFTPINFYDEKMNFIDSVYIERR